MFLKININLIPMQNHFYNIKLDLSQNNMIIGKLKTDFRLDYHRTLFH